MMHYEKSLESLWRWLAGALVAVLAAPFVLLIGLTKLTDWIGAMPWWQRYWGRVQWHDDEARRSCGAKRWKHYAMMWLLGSPVWVPLIWLALWGLGKADR